MTQPAKVQEPSMEEILASIRRIISDDDTTGKAVAMPPKAVPPPAPPPLRAETPLRPTTVPPPPRSVSALPRDRDAIQQDIEAVLGEPDKLAVDDGSKAAGNGADTTADADILDLTEEMAAEPPISAPMEEPAASFRTIDGQPDVFFADNPVEPEPELEPVQAFPSEHAPAPFGFDNLQTRSIMSNATSSAVDSAFNQLAQSVFTQNGRTIEDLVRDMMRPMLKTWLDDNLPGLVERLVRAEIERVSRGR